MAIGNAQRRLAAFYVHGPFPIAIAKNSHGRELDRDELETFWDGEHRAILAERCGCYVFAIWTRTRHIPSYVGQTGAGFTRERFPPRHVGLYNRAPPQHGQSGVPVLFLPCGHSRTVKSRIIGEIETFFIQHGADRNPNLLNAKGRSIATWRIPGVLRSGGGKPSQAARHLRKALGL